MPRNAVNLSPTWAADGRVLFFISSLDGAKDVWRVPLGSNGHPAGAPERLSTGLDGSDVESLSRWTDDGVLYPAA